MKGPATFKQKQCAVCGGKFQPHKSLQNLCSPACEIIRKRKGGRTTARPRSQRSPSTKSLSYYRTRALIAFGAYILIRDADEPCISCGSWQGPFQPGHYRTIGSCPELSFHEDNCHKQCVFCNYGSGNIQGYTPNLIIKIGQARFDRLTGPHPLPHLTRLDYEKLRREYRAKAQQQKREG